MALQSLTIGTKTTGVDHPEISEGEKLTASEMNQLVNRFNFNVSEQTTLNSTFNNKPSTATVQTIAWGTYAEPIEDGFQLFAGVFYSVKSNGSISGAVLNPASYQTQRAICMNNCVGSGDVVTINAGSGNSWFKEAGVLTESITIPHLRGIRITSDKSHWVVERL